jgi:predicted SAM-dependent methyltransferase
MATKRVYDINGRDLIRLHLNECDIILDLGSNEETIFDRALSVDNGTNLTEEQLRNIDYVLDLNDIDSLPSCDGICMSHLLEHIVDTRKILKLCYNSLNDNGRIAIAVPDGETVPANTLGDSSLTHEMLFTPITLKLYLEHAGFKNVVSKYYDRPYAYKQTNGIFASGKK